jgi:hypothetical protein
MGMYIPAFAPQRGQVLLLLPELVLHLFPENFSKKNRFSLKKLSKHIGK